jgi:hypothetical protein
MKRIVVVTCSLDASEDQVFATCKKDKELIDVIQERIVSLEKHGVKIIKSQDNIIQTENNYELAFFEEDLEKPVENK